MPRVCASPNRQDMILDMIKPHSVIGVDMPLDVNKYPLRQLLDAFKEAVIQRPDLRLVLAGRRVVRNEFSVWNYLDENGLTDHVDFLPYYERCHVFPCKKADVDVWIDRDVDAKSLTTASLLEWLEGQASPAQKLALFVTSFHPGKYEGNSTLMRQWLDYLKAAGYGVHVLYYALDRNSVPSELRRKVYHEYEMWVEVDVTTCLVGANRNGLNVHVDDWCGKELLDEASRLTQQFEYDVAVVNYPFTSAVFDRIAAYTNKILLMHDSFSDRNRRLLSQGYPEAAWVSIDAKGEGLACKRADVVVALQDSEAEIFRKMVDESDRVRVVSPVPTAPQARPAAPSRKLRIGYIGSGNYVNEHNLIAFLAEWATHPQLVANSEIVLAGKVCDSLSYYAPAELLEVVQPRKLGQVSQLFGFFEACDLAINPDLGGSGIKIKTLDAMAHGAALLCTAAGGIGIGSPSRFHAAADPAALAKLALEITVDRGLLEVARNDTRNAYAAYVARHRAAMADLLGPVVVRDTPAKTARRGRSKPGFVVPDYVRQHATDFQLEEFDKVFSRIDLNGKHVLEIGCDYHLASARLFAANGAADVIATSLADWRSAEPMPPNVSFQVGDASYKGLPDQSIDIVYGIAILEHLPDIEHVALAIKRVLKPGGIAYLQGCPIWSGPYGHHIWLCENQIGGHESKSNDPANPLYSFADAVKNPIPHWSHLTHNSAQLADLLVDSGLPRDHAHGVSEFVFNRDGKFTGACSNFVPASEIMAKFSKYLDVKGDPILAHEQENVHFQEARALFTEEDLRSNGLRLWLTHKTEPSRIDRVQSAPAVSLIVPFFNVEKYIADCLNSVLEQDFENFEIILIDDASQDTSRAVVEHFAAQDARIRVVTHRLNHGLGAARNTGVRHARGDYLLFLDSDDVLSGSGALEALVSAAESTHARVVVGSCNRLMPDGSLLHHDRVHDRDRQGRPGHFVDGREAFMSTLGLPGYQYIPMRAWGSLIESAYYEELALDFPAGEHEDMPHTPFLYLQSGGVFYEEAVVVNYRERTDGLSSTPWPADKLQRYISLWQEMKSRMLRFGLADEVGDAALAFINHLMWKIDGGQQTHDIGDSGRLVIRTLMADIDGAKNQEILHRILARLPQTPWNAVHDFDSYLDLTAKVPIDDLLKYHQAKLGLRFQSADLATPAPLPARPVAAAMESVAAPAAPTSSPIAEETNFFANNEALQARIYSDYFAHASEHLKTFPSMLTFGDKALYYHAGKNFRFRGSIVDGGCFVGGTTTALVEGLRSNPTVVEGKADTVGLIRVYDLFRIDDDYILRHLRDNYPEQTFKAEGSFQEVFERNLANASSMLQVRPGDVTRIGYNDRQPIEVFGVDFCKALFVTDFAVRAFFTRLVTGALVIQQDYVHEFHPHIHLSMLRLADHFDLYVELKRGGSVAFTCIKPITPQIVRERFGDDASWYKDVAVNAPLLRRLVEECHYEENRWIFLLALALYHRDIGLCVDAYALFRESLERFPQFEPSELTRRLLES
jgi:glycosyltransferase involved in cell wall biosynthesis/SAM-dependent methyltransferase